MNPNLLLLDLDNTLIDRDAAFRSAAAAFLADNALPEADLGWLMALDASGYTPKPEVTRALHERYAVPEAAVRELVDGGAADRVVLSGTVREALVAASADGWTCVVVTNGRTAQQERKLRRTGLDGLVRGWVISEAVGHAKPSPEIFHAAATVGGRPLSGAWMVGDSAHADIGGAHGLGLRNVWVSNGRAWEEPGFRPTWTEGDVVAAIGRVRASGR